MADNQIDTGDLMDCLVQNKHQKEMNEKCSVGVTHFQLVSRLMEMCSSDISVQQEQKKRSLLFIFRDKPHTPLLFNQEYNIIIRLMGKYS